jgi:hypothetical protein
MADCCVVIATMMVAPKVDQFLRDMRFLVKKTVRSSYYENFFLNSIRKKQDDTVVFGTAYYDDGVSLALLSLCVDAFVM